MQLFIAALVALSITALLIPFLAKWAPALGFTDVPGPRKVHAVPVPRVGGLAMALGIAVPILLLQKLAMPTLQGFMAGFIILVVCGAWDDRANLHYGLKFAGQAAAVLACMAIGGVAISTLSLGGEAIPLPKTISLALTFLFLVGVTNAVNLADGLDGLAGGTALLCLSAIALLAVASGNTLVTSLALIEAGAILGFLRFNTHPARVFMGDAGSQVLGFSIGVLAILATQSVTAPYSAALPLLIVGLPILDTLAVMFQRMRNGRSPFSSDRNHLHHRLLALGLRHAEAVTVAYLLQGMLFLLAYFLRFESDLLIVSVLAAFATIVFGAMWIAKRSGWQPHSATGARPRFNRRGLGALCAISMVAALLAYAALVICGAVRVGLDVIALSAAMVLLLELLSGTRATRPLRWLERTAAYTGVGLLVYLDESGAAAAGGMEPLTYALFAIMGIAALLRLGTSTSQQFQLTSLDVLVVFIALVVPNLPGSFALPAQLASGLAKAIVLLYVVEMLLAIELRKPIPRAFVSLVLGSIVLRGVITLGA